MKDTFGISGEVTVKKFNQKKELTWEETVENDATDDLRNKLVDALCNHNYSWSTTGNGAVALDDPNAFANYGPDRCANLGGSGFWNMDCAVIGIKEVSTSNKITLKPTATYIYGATAGPGLVYYNAQMVEYLSTTNSFDSAEIGVINDFSGTGSGTFIWRTQWATASFTAIEVAPIDSLEIQWQIRFNVA